MVHVAVVAHELQSARHLADGEEAEHLGGQDAGADELRAVHVADAGEHGFGRHAGGGGRAGHQGGGVAEGVDDWGQVALEGSDVSDGGGGGNDVSWRTCWGDEVRWRSVL